jgi:hypothetical protein
MCVALPLVGCLKSYIIIIIIIITTTIIIIIIIIITTTIIIIIIIIIDMVHHQCPTLVGTMGGAGAEATRAAQPGPLLWGHSNQRPSVLKPSSPNPPHALG